MKHFHFNLKHVHNSSFFSEGISVTDSAMIRHLLGFIDLPFKAEGLKLGSVTLTHAGSGTHL